MAKREIKTFSRDCEVCFDRTWFNLKGYRYYFKELPVSVDTGIQNSETFLFIYEPELPRLREALGEDLYEYVLSMDEGRALTEIDSTSGGCVYFNVHDFEETAENGGYNPFDFLPKKYRHVAPNMVNGKLPPSINYAKVIFDAQENLERAVGKRDKNDLEFDAYYKENGMRPGWDWTKDEKIESEIWAARATLHKVKDSLQSQLNDAGINLDVRTAIDIQRGDESRTPVLPSRVSQNLCELIEVVAGVDDLESQECHDSFTGLMDVLGVTDGGFASIYFSGKDESWKETSFDDRCEIVIDYVSLELSHLRGERGSE